MSSPTIKHLVPEEADGERLDRFLAEALPQYSREYLKSLILQGNVTLADAPIVKPSYRVIEGTELTLAIPEPKPLTLPAEDIPLEIIFEDTDLLVVNKPSGMLTHPTGREQTGTLVNALLFHCDGTLSGINGVERPGIVHRLDRETSGLLMVAKTDIAHRGLQQQLQERTAKRRYRAIAQGIFATPTGTVNASIDRHPKKRDKMGVFPTGREAITHWEVLDTLGEKFSVVKLSLETGRTHQIRVHLAHIGHPLFGDPLYGTGLEKIVKFDPHGQILQAFQLAFTHPVSGNALEFEIPPDEKFLAAKAFLCEWIQ
jgi:23S rRNA pseudouridine1911/1915/1917 synthase